MCELSYACHSFPQNFACRHQSPAGVLTGVILCADYEDVQFSFAGSMEPRQMTDSQAEKQPAEWRRQRLRRHVGEIMRLAWPTMLSRLGIMGLAVTDTIMVGRFSTDQLAYLSLGSSSVIMLILMIVIGLLIGTLVFSADAYGRGDWAECGAVWRRSLLFAILLGALATASAMPAETLLLATGQTPELSREGGRVMFVLGLGLGGHILFVVCTFFLEGIERPKAGMYAMVAANLANIGLNYMLVYGHGGFPALGAEGSAWATTILRILLAGGMVLYVLFAPSLAKYRIRRRHLTPWRDWRAQRHMGYASGVSLGAEVVAFAALSLFAGWLGKLPLAAYGLIFNIMTLPFMLALGVGTATGVRVGIANARADAADATLAGWTGLTISTLGLLLASVLIFVFGPKILGLYSSDPALVALALPLVALVSWVIILDGDQAVLANALRGLGETWIPTLIQSIAYIAVMLPVSWALALPLGRGVAGLLEALIVGSVVSVVLQSWWFRVKSAQVGRGGK